MCKLLVPTRLAALVCLAFAALVISASGDDKPQPKRANVPNAVEFAVGDQQILSVLDEPADMDFVETPLKDVVASISIAHKNIPILLDQTSIKDVGVSADTPITFSLMRNSLKSSMRHMLRQYGLDFVIDNDALVITSVERPTTLRKFEVADLLSNGTSVEKLGEAVRFALPRVSADNSVPDGEVMPFESVLLVRSNYHGFANVETFLEELRHDKSKHDAAAKASADR